MPVATSSLTLFQNCWPVGDFSEKAPQTSNARLNSEVSALQDFSNLWMGAWENTTQPALLQHWVNLLHPWGIFTRLAVPKMEITIPVFWDTECSIMLQNSTRTTQRCLLLCMQCPLQIRDQWGLAVNLHFNISSTPREQNSDSFYDIWVELKDVSACACPHPCSAE